MNAGDRTSRTAAPVLAVWLALTGGCAEPPAAQRGARPEESAPRDTARLPVVPDSTFVGAWRSHDSDAGTGRGHALVLRGSGAATMTSERAGEAAAVRLGGWQPTGDGRALAVFTNRGGAAITDTLSLVWGDAHLVATPSDTASWGVSEIRLYKDGAP